MCLKTFIESRVRQPDRPGQPEVGNLDDVVLADQNVSGGKIAMDIVLGLEVGHAGSDLEKAQLRWRLHF